MVECLRIPLKRVAVLIGRDGQNRHKIEQLTQTSLQIESDSGEVFIEQVGEDPLSIWKARDMVKAIGRGFSPEKALLMQNDDNYFYLIDLHELFGSSSKKLERLKGRVIGKNGKMRNLIEQITKTYISIYGKTISLIGNIGQIEVAKEAIKMLLSGATHSTVVNFLNRKKREVSNKESELKKLALDDG